MARYTEIIRDQIQTKTCVAHAVAAAIDAMVLRKYPKNEAPIFSAAWLHMRTGNNPDDGRRMGEVIDQIRNTLPCEDRLFSIQAMRSGLPAIGSPERKRIDDSSFAFKQRYGTPLVRRLDVEDISNIKAHLAAGWVVVVSTYITPALQDNRFDKLGLPLAPVIGQHRLPAGHAWLLLGYEHVDGNYQWKYQGRFIALNSWGRDWPMHPTSGRQGICTIPFAMLLTEGIDAYAMRFP